MSGLLASVGVRSKVQLTTPPIGYVRVQLGRGEVGVAEHLLNRAQVCAAFEQVRGERVAEQMRMDPRRLEPRDSGQAAQDQERARPCEPAALRVEEELGPVALVEVRAAAREVAAQRVDGFA